MRPELEQQVESLAIGGRSYWSVEYASRFLRVTPAHVRRLGRSGVIAVARAGSRVWLRQDSVREYARRRGPWPVHGVYGGRQEAEDQGLLPRREVA